MSSFKMNNLSGGTAFSTSSIQLPDKVVFASSANIQGLVEFKHEGI